VAEGVLDHEPQVLVAVALDPPLSWSVLFAPFFGAMLTPNCERYGDGWLHENPRSKK
jgi:hypothetical protein